MMAFGRRALLVAALVLVSHSAYALFGDNEPARRKAFIDFLQTQIVNRSGVHVPILNGDDEKKFGDYTKHYAVITGFAGDATLTTLGRKMAQGLPPLTSMQSVVDQRETIRRVGAEMGELAKTLDEKLAKTNAEKDALKQPPDLKTVYDAAYNKIVANPGAAFREALPLAQKIAVSAADIGDYVAAHATTVKIVGGSFQATNAKTRTELEALVKALTSQTAVYNEAQRKVGLAIQGN